MVCWLCLMSSLVLKRKATNMLEAAKDPTRVHTLHSLWLVESRVHE
jgi:hypothetical protein